MKGPYIRSCRKHQSELKARYDPAGHESLWCTSSPHGSHKCRSWNVKDSNGETIFVGHIDATYQVVSPEVGFLDEDPFLPPMPVGACQRGHENEWVLTSDIRYRCRACLKIGQARRNAKRKADLEAREAYKKTPAYIARLANQREYRKRMRIKYPEKYAQYQSNRRLKRKQRQKNV
jgi:hypothetical protein